MQYHVFACYNQTIKTELSSFWPYGINQIWANIRRNYISRDSFWAQLSHPKLALTHIWTTDPGKTFGTKYVQKVQISGWLCNKIRTPNSFGIIFFKIQLQVIDLQGKHFVKMKRFGLLWTIFAAVSADMYLHNPR